MAKIEANSDIMTRDQVFDLLIKLERWAAVVRGDKGRFNDGVTSLIGRSLSDDIDRAIEIIEELLPDDARTVDLRRFEDEPAPPEKVTTIHDSLTHGARTVTRIVDRLLGPEVLQHWDYVIGCEKRPDLVDLAVMSGDEEAKELRARDPSIGARLLPLLGYALEKDRCVPVPETAINKAYDVIERKLGHLMDKTANVHFLQPPVSWEGHER
jgi:hypothetical protein